ncbi:diguanylate cyclase (GGDEF)-like protein [Ruminiclostridium sufflavum DSM 19573]|uniref:Diguanylate cyclase (GGDEF)-like protein n=1 Tax=Ruminiclostridium sufflavum DSM 19573 TaxID=1121337 RepID=A0A318XP61_9FIRM|nr:GGDEF domain-containing protein [Ruminiclostridium sufflavum]PYG89556.1 diguanylate cyclase (GGDEF)-like protein [Ruminiclostridium sufflavum DSM 19573]
MSIEIPNLFSELLTSIAICYIIYRLNKDLKRTPAINYILSSLVIALGTFLSKYMFSDRDKIVMFLLNTLVINFVIIGFYKYNGYYSILTALFGIILIEFAEILVTFVYVLPLKITIYEYRTSIIHILAGNALLFLFIYVFLSLIGDKFVRARKRIHMKHRRLTVLLSVNLIAVGTILLFVYITLYFYADFRLAGYSGNKAYYDILLVTAAAAASIIGNLYLVNNCVLFSFKYDRLKMMYVMDEMTDTLNRESGLRVIESQLNTCKEVNSCLTLCYVDVNDLKLVNDRLGHREGDQLIKAVAGTIKGSIRETDIICRLGGDEFAIVFPGCNIEYSEKVMKRIYEKVKKLKLFKAHSFDVSFSYGFSEFEGSGDATVDELLEQADHQMYLNKRAVKTLI